jgi:Flp pilus assembly protein TadG
MRQADDRDRGSSLIEFALVLPVLCTLLFGIIDFGWVLNDYVSVRQGVREGARQAAVKTQPTPSSGTWAGNGCVITGPGAGFSTTNPDAYDLMCYVKERTGLNQTNTRVKVWFDNTGGSPVYASGKPVTICVQYPARSVSGFMSPFLTGILSSKSTIRIEQNSATFTTPAEETALTSWPASCQQS